MRKHLLLLPFLVACTAAPPPTAAPAATAPHGLTVEEEARILALEDRRELDPVLAAEWVTNPNALHRGRLAMALGRIGSQTFVDANGNGERDPGERQAGVDHLTQLASDADPTVRIRAAFALGEIGDAAGVEPLLKLSGDEDSRAASEAIEALSKLNKHVPLARYAPLATTGPDGVRVAAIRFLFRFNTDEASAVAATALESNSPAIRQEGAYALSRRAYAPAREKLELLMGDPNVNTRAYAAAALGRIAAAGSMPVLVTALGDAHPWVRTNAAVAISRVAAATPGALSAEEVPRMLALSEDADTGTRATAIETLGWYAKMNDTARKRLSDIAANGSRWERELAVAAIATQFGEATPAAIPAELTSWQKNRLLEAAAKMKSGGAAIRRRLATDPDVMVRANAVGSIPDATVDAELSLIRAALEETDVVVRGNAVDRYAATKSEPQDARVATLRSAEEKARQDRDNDARLAAIRGLAGIEYPERESFLRLLISYGDPVVRRVAADLIEETLKKNRPQFTPLPVRPVDYAEVARWAQQPHTATIHMTRGVIEMALLPQDAPMTAWNFAQLAKSKFFDNTSFMRVVPNFVVQGGDPRNDQNGGPGYAIRDEINMQKYTRGALGMALSGFDTGGSQFFITHSPQPHLDGGYTIFGRVFSGMSGVVDQTERGDRVETITIDQHAPVAAAELTGVQGTPLPLVIGPITPDTLISTVPEYRERKASYVPDDAVVEMIAAALKPEDRVEVYMGTWCDDSQREVPKFLRISDALREKYGKTLPATFLAVDRSKTKPENLLAGKAIEKVATFIVYRGDRELGRIVERPTSLFEDDLLVLVSR
ncbi:MAG: HEAT repeat domain-containing protein [Thermoanaerobaculia bacterium]